MGFNNQLNIMTDNSVSFGQMAQHGNVLASDQGLQQGTDSAGVTKGASQSSNIQTQELASALTTMLQGPSSAGPTSPGHGTPQQHGNVMIGSRRLEDVVAEELHSLARHGGGSTGGDSRLQNTVRRLAEFVNSGEPAGPAVAFEDQPAFKRLRAEVEALSKRTGSLEESLSFVCRSIDETNQNVRQLMAMMQRADPWMRGHGGQGNPGGEGNGGGINQAVAYVGGCAFQKTMTTELHTEALGYIGVSTSRREVKALAENLPMEFKAWWEVVSPSKGAAQWRKKLENLGATEEQYKDANAEAVGDLLFRYLVDDGTWSDTPLQDSPP